MNNALLEGNGDSDDYGDGSGGYGDGHGDGYGYGNGYGDGYGDGYGNGNGGDGNGDGNGDAIWIGLLTSAGQTDIRETVCHLLLQPLIKRP